MSANWLSGGALTVVGALFVVIFLLRKKGADFTVVIIGALVAGFVVGAVFQGHTDLIEPLGKVYVSVLSALVIPLIVVSIVSSVTSLSSVAQLKGIGLRSVFWLLFSTLIAIVLAMGLALTFGLGRGSGISIQGVDASNYQAAPASLSAILVGMVPRNIVSDVGSEHVVPVILFSMLVAVAYVFASHEHGDKVLPFKQAVEALKVVIFKAVAFVIELTPYAVLALTVSVASNGLSRTGMMWSMLALLIVSFLAFALDIWAVNAVLLSAFARVNPVRFFRKIIPAQLIGFSTQSSAGTLPVTTKILTEEVGVSSSVAAFTGPLGTTIGMPGCSGIWPVLVAIFGIHGLGLHYSLQQYAMLALVSLIVSLGTAGVPGTATVVTAAVLTAVGLPLQILVLVIPISTIADTGRTATNITAAMVVSTIVARAEGLLDDVIFYGDEVFAPAPVAAPIQPEVAPSIAAAVAVPRQTAQPGLTEPLVPVADAAYAALAEMTVGEACPF